jgi:hypothetical protein
MVTSCTDYDHPYYKELGNKTDKERYQFFTEDNAKRMKFVSLGEALDFVSIGGGNFVAYNFGTRAMVDFIKGWIEGQKSKIKYRTIGDSKIGCSLEEESRQTFYMWNKFHRQEEIPELPRIDYSSCPMDKNNNTFIMDRGGRLRCAHQKRELINPDFAFMSISEGLGTSMKRYSFTEFGPEEPSSYDEDDNDITDLGSEEYKEYLARKEKFEAGKSTALVDTCYAVIKEPKNMYLPLETVLERIDCSPDNKWTAHPFTGFTLATFVQAWWEQPGDRKYLRNNNTFDDFRAFKDFPLISTED